MHWQPPPPPPPSRQQLRCVVQQAAKTASASISACTVQCTPLCGKDLSCDSRHYQKVALCPHYIAQAVHWSVGKVSVSQTDYRPVAGDWNGERTWVVTFWGQRDNYPDLASVSSLTNAAGGTSTAGLLIGTESSKLANVESDALNVRSARACAGCGQSSKCLTST